MRLTASAGEKPWAETCEGDKDNSVKATTRKVAVELLGVFESALGEEVECALGRKTEALGRKTETALREEAKSALGEEPTFPLSPRLEGFCNSTLVNGGGRGQGEGGNEGG
jgi:hypothetical protein